MATLVPIKFIVTMAPDDSLRPDCRDAAAWKSILRSGCASCGQPVNEGQILFPGSHALRVRHQGSDVDGVEQCPAVYIRAYH